MLGFLKAYCAELAGERTSSLARLLAAAAGGSPRVAEPLFLLAVERGRADRLVRMSEGTWMEGEWRQLLAQTLPGEGAEGFLVRVADAPPRYRAVLDAFRARDDLAAADRRAVALMRGKTLEALQASSMTRYRLCRELGVNKGNLYAWLAGDDSKVGRGTARRVMEHALAAAGQ